MNPDVTKMLLEAILGVIAVLITGYLIPWLKNTVGQDKFDQIQQVIEAAVRAAEQLYTPEQWKEKKMYVVELATIWAGEIGIELTPEQLNAIIEGVVNYVKHNEE